MHLEDIVLGLSLVLAFGAGEDVELHHFVCILVRDVCNIYKDFEIFDLMINFEKYITFSIQSHSQILKFSFS